MSLSQTVAELRAELETNSVGDLPLWARLRLWRAMEKEFPRDGGLRRSYFALFVFEQLLPVWDRANVALPYRELPHLLRLAARTHLLGVGSRESVIAISRDCGEVFQYLVCACPSDDNGDTAAVQLAAEFVADRVVGMDDETYQRLGMYDELELPDLTQRPTEQLMGDAIPWDAHFIGSVIAANGAIWDEQSNNDARREYWNMWLKNWLPQFTGDLAKAREAVGLTVSAEDESYCKYFREWHIRQGR